MGYDMSKSLGMVDDELDTDVAESQDLGSGNDKGRRDLLHPNIKSAEMDAMAEDFHSRGAKLLSSGDNAGALSIYNEAIKSNPLNVEAYFGKVTALRALNAPLDMHAEVFRTLDQITALRDAKHIEIQDYYRVPLQRGVEQHLMHENLRAIESYKEALVLSPESPEAHLNLGLTYADLGMHSEAQTSYLLSLSFRKTPEAHSAYARSLASNQDPVVQQTALIEYDKAIALDINEPRYYAEKALLQWGMGSSTSRHEALGTLDKALNVLSTNTALSASYASYVGNELLELARDMSSSVSIGIVPLSDPDRAVLSNIEHLAERVSRKDAEVLANERELRSSQITQAIDEIGNDSRALTYYEDVRTEFTSMFRECNPVLRTGYTVMIESMAEGAMQMCAAVYVPMLVATIRAKSYFGAAGTAVIGTGIASIGSYIGAIPTDVKQQREACKKIYLKEKFSTSSLDDNAHNVALNLTHIRKADLLKGVVDASTLAHADCGRITSYYQKHSNAMVTNTSSFFVQMRDVFNTSEFLGTDPSNNWGHKIYNGACSIPYYTAKLLCHLTDYTCRIADHMTNHFLTHPELLVYACSAYIGNVTLIGDGSSVNAVGAGEP